MIYQIFGGKINFSCQPRDPSSSFHSSSGQDKKVFSNNKKSLIILVAIFLITAILVVPNVAHAGLDTVLVNIASWLAQMIIYVVGQLLVISISILVKVASFNDFVNANVVNIGWVIVRDIANMMIVVGMLIIAFYTVLNKQSYEYKRMLPKLIIAALLVNFSKTITGLLIDVGQVIMMTFVHAFEDIAAGNLTYGFGIQDLLSMRNAAEGAGVEVNDWSVFGSLVLGVLMVAVAFAVVLIMVVMLLGRIVILWLLCVFSPVAFVAGLLPSMQKFADRWWSELTKNIVFGPTLAFLFWLAMSVLSQITKQNRVMNLEMLSQEYQASSGAAAASPVNYTFFASQVSSPQRIFDFMVTCALLIMCVIFAKEAGVAGSQFASNVYGKFQNAGRWVARRPAAFGRTAWKGVKSGAELTYLPAGVRALTQRVRTSKTGQKLGWDKEYSKTKAEERQAIMTTKWGGPRGESALRNFQYMQAQKTRKEMKDKGELEGGEDALRDKLDKARKSGDMDKTRAIMLEMAQSKQANLRTEDLLDYEQAEGVERNSGTQKEKDFMLFMEELKEMQNASGDAMADYKFDVRRNAKGDLEYVSNKAKQVGDDFDKKKTAEFNNKGIFKGFDEELPEWLALLDSLAKKTDMQGLGIDGRAGYAKILQKILARHYDTTDNFKIKDPAQLDRYELLLQKMYAKKFVQGTGEAYLDEADVTRPEDVKLVQRGHEEFTSATGIKVNADGTLDKSGINKSVLNKVAVENRQKKTKAERESRVHGLETRKLTEADKETDKSILRPIIVGGKKELRPQLYKTVNEGRENELDDTPAYMSLLAKNLADLEMSINNNVNIDWNAETKMINPQTGKNYTNRELYNNSGFYKNVGALGNMLGQDFSSLAPEDKKKFRQELENRADNLLFDFQRAQNPQTGRLQVLDFGVDKPDQHRRKKTLENRQLRREGLGLVVDGLDKLSMQDLLEKDRQKILNTLLSNTKMMHKHTTVHMPDNELLIDKLDLLQKMIEGLKKGEISEEKIRGVLERYARRGVQDNDVDEMQKIAQRGKVENSDLGVLRGMADGLLNQVRAE